MNEPTERGPGEGGTPPGGAQAWGPMDAYGTPAAPAAPAPPPPPVDPVPGGEPYHLLARTARNRWWRPVVGTLFVLGLGAVFTLGLGIVLGIVAFASGVDMSDPEALYTEMPLLTLVTTALGLALALPLVLFAVRFIQRRPVGSASSVTGGLRWGWMALCAAVGLGAMLVGWAVSLAYYLLSGQGLGEFEMDWAGWSAFLPAAAVVLVLIPFQAAAEEYVFRGWLMQAFGSFMRTPWPGALISSLIFMSLHGYRDWGMVWVFLFGLCLVWVTVRTGGLEAAIGLHVVHNVGGFLLAAAAGEAATPLDQGSVSWEIMLGPGVELLIFLAVVLPLAKKRNIATRS
ncbi:CPBP family intramembrane metalloprotease [Nocardiopsis sp. RSe5-2]|uniref:CPBP family intramembrane metalloprotease n=1 Tax=Nocardiopsis endophytica TaxID=3018445 RepID=A0ABT4UBG1_9ACTN|nr:CPBP family intramembrane glutamic endopeptidase [Nocardiopsis endophytica]MDA2814315.1 CPBP family intramembrane metalloprotease [Nocardiopsis endophytica]